MDRGLSGTNHVSRRNDYRGQTTFLDATVTVYRGLSLLPLAMRLPATSSPQLHAE